MPFRAADDPAHAATRHPEPPGATDAVSVVGIGPGDPDFLTRPTRRAIANADVVLGFESVLHLVEEEIRGDALPCTYEIESEMLATFARRVDNGSTGVVDMMGNPNVSDYQFLGKIERAISGPVEVIPGVPSVQIAAARSRTPREESTFVTFHKRGPIESDLETLARDVGRRLLLVLPRPYDWMPPEIAELLQETGASESSEAFVFERLTHPGERASRFTLGDPARSQESETGSSTYSDMSILVIKKPIP